MSSHNASDERLLARLRESELVDVTVLNELLEFQRSCWKPFGRVAIDLGMMRIVQVAKVLGCQAVRPERSFGECARHLGFLRREQVDQIAEHQRRLVPSLAEILVTEMVLEVDEVERLLTDPTFESRTL